MELWVRSQDKMKLVKVNYCYIMDQQDHFTIIGETIDSGPIIATYKSKERALEVLDEIQNILIIKNSFNLSEEIINKCFENNTEEEIQKIVKTLAVYEMPEE